MPTLAESMEEITLAWLDYPRLNCGIDNIFKENMNAKTQADKVKEAGEPKPKTQILHMILSLPDGRKEKVNVECLSSVSKSDLQIGSLTEDADWNFKNL